MSKGAAGLLAAILVIGLPISLLAHNWGAVFFSPELIAEAISARFIDSGMIQDMAIEAMLTRGKGQDSLPGSFDFLDDSGRRKLIETLIPSGWAKDQLTRMVEDLYAWIDSDELAPKLMLDVQPIKDRLFGGGARDLVVQLVDSWPACERDQIEQVRGKGFSEFSILCQPPEPLRGGLIQEGTDVVLGMMRELPSTIEFGEQLGGGEAADIQRLKEGIRLTRAAARLGWLLPLSTLGLIMAIAVRSFPSLLRWWGAPLLGAGGASFIAAAATRPLVEEMTREALLGSKLPVFLTDAFLAIGNDLLDSIMDRMLGQAILIGLVGLAMLALGLYLKRRESAANAA